MNIIPSNSTVCSELLWKPICIIAEDKITLIAISILALAGAVLYCFRQHTPTRNLLRSVGTAITHHKNPLESLKKNLKELPKDEHGNILLGLDNDNFTLWRHLYRYIVPTKIFGPILIPTNHQVIHAILKHPKNGSTDSPFIGNFSTDNIQHLYGDQQGFSGVNHEAHINHRAQFKEWISDEFRNIEIVTPVIHNWLQRHLHAIITEHDIENLTAQLMLTFLLDINSAKSEKSLEAIVQIKTHFINMGLKPITLDRVYPKALSHMGKMIEDLLYSRGSYPYFLSSSLTLEHVQSHILALMSVGFDNLQSSLMSLFVRLAAMDDETRDHLKSEINPENAPFIRFAKDDTSKERMLFLEMMRLAPPVWLQSRKSANEDSWITYKTESDEKKTFKLHPSTLTLIPNFALNRQMENPEVFDLGRNPNEYRPIHPFSQGPNTCPGQKIPYAALGVLAAALLRGNLSLELQDEMIFNPSVALTMKNIRVQISERK